MATVLVPLAEGFEEIEAASIVDVLRRAGVEVVVAGILGAGPYRGSRGLQFVAEAGFLEVMSSGKDGFDLVVLPGGSKGVDNLLRSEVLLELLRQRVLERRMVAAICAAPRVLDAAGVLSPGQFTCYPGLQQQLKTPGRRNEMVVDSGVVITSQGPGTAVTFALHLVRRLVGESMQSQVARGLLVH